MVIPPFLLFTVLSNYIVVCMIVLTLLAIVTVYYNCNNSLPITDVLCISLPSRKKTFLNNFRAYVNIATAISILAVDFAIFPIRFTKTDKYGTGLMDVGVGSFMISNALVSQDARGISASLSFFEALKKEVRAVFVLLSLGLVRLLALKVTQYENRVGEYGVHWNFFLTLAFVRVCFFKDFIVVLSGTRTFNDLAS